MNQDLSNGHVVLAVLAVLSFFALAFWTLLATGSGATTGAAAYAAFGSATVLGLGLSLRK